MFLNLSKGKVMNFQKTKCVHKNNLCYFFQVNDEEKKKLEELKALRKITVSKTSHSCQTY